MMIRNYARGKLRVQPAASYGNCAVHSYSSSATLVLPHKNPTDLEKGPPNTESANQIS